jgi:hypothetical protein
MDATSVADENDKITLREISEDKTIPAADLWCEICIHYFAPSGANIAAAGKHQMNETTRKYIDRILGYTQGRKPLDVQAATASTLARLVEGVPASTLRKRPAPEQWSVVEILAHLADSEVVCGWRLRASLGAPGSPIAAFDQNAWAVAGHYAERDARESIEQFRAMRQANLSLLHSLTPEQWQHHGIHSERGKETIERMVTMFAGHDLNHVQQIERILAGSKNEAA